MTRDRARTALEEGLVGQAGACQGLVQGEGAAVVAAGLEDAADAGKGQLGDAAFGTEGVEDELDGLEEVGVAGAALPTGQVAEPGSGEVLVVAVAGLAEARPRFRGNVPRKAGSAAHRGLRRRTRRGFGTPGGAAHG